MQLSPGSLTCPVKCHDHRTCKSQVACDLATRSYTWLINFTLHFFIASAMNFYLHRRIIATTPSVLYRLGHQSALALSGAKVLRIADYLHTNAFPDLVVVGQEECPCALPKKATRGATSKMVRQTAGQTRPGLTLGTSTLASTIYHTTRWVGVTAK